MEHVKVVKQTLFFTGKSNTNFYEILKKKNFLTILFVFYFITFHFLFFCFFVLFLAKERKFFHFKKLNDFVTLFALSLSLSLFFPWGK